MPQKSAAEIEIKYQKSSDYVPFHQDFFRTEIPEKSYLFFFAWFFRTKVSKNSHLIVYKFLQAVNNFYDSWKSFGTFVLFQQ